MKQKCAGACGAGEGRAKLSCLAPGSDAPAGVSLDVAGFGVPAGEFHEKSLVLVCLQESCMR